MPYRVKIVVIEPFEAYEIIEGEVPWLPFSFKADDGRIFSLFPHHELFDLVNWYREGRLTVDMINKQTKEGLTGWMCRLE